MGATPLEGLECMRWAAGVYNLDAQARSINADTVMKFNDYVASSALESMYMYNLRKAANIQHNKAMYNEASKRSGTTRIGSTSKKAMRSTPPLTI